MNDRKTLATSERVIIKIGSRLLRDDLERCVRMLADETRALRARGTDVVIVTSGAIALGVHDLGLPARPTELPGLQAAAAVGQGRLMQVYREAFGDLRLGQVLLTHDDVRNRRRYLNARLAFGELLRLGAVPVVNENDTVSVDEIKFGDNDQLAALVTSIVGADLLIILTDVEGLYDGDPAKGAMLIPEVVDLEHALSVAGGASSGVGTGGMRSKVEAAVIAGRFGVRTVVASGRQPRPVTRIIAGEPLGTVFWPSVDRLAARKHWIAYALKAQGTLRVDDGARTALVDGKKSLLPGGIREVRGLFEAGDAVAIADDQGRTFARGLCSLGADEVKRVAGHRASEMAQLLGYPVAETIIHRDDLVIL